MACMETMFEWFFHATNNTKLGPSRRGYTSDIYLEYKEQETLYQTIL